MTSNASEEEKIGEVSGNFETKEMSLIWKRKNLGEYSRSLEILEEPSHGIKNVFILFQFGHQN